MTAIPVSVDDPPPPIAEAPRKPKAKKPKAKKPKAPVIIPDWPDSPVFLPEVVSQIRAGDCAGIYENKTDAHILGNYVLSPEKRRSIPILGDPDARVLRRLKTFYHAVSVAIGRRTDVIAVPIFDLSEEGFGRVVLVAGRLAAVSRTLRDVHRFGFGDLAEMDAAGAALVEEGVALITAHPGLAGAD